jgi:hypothetical protein
MPPGERLTRRQALTRGGIALLGLASGGTGVRLAAARASRNSPAGPEPGKGGPAAEPAAGPPTTSAPAGGATVPGVRPRRRRSLTRATPLHRPRRTCWAGWLIPTSRMWPGVGQ